MKKRELYPSIMGLLLLSGCGGTLKKVYHESINQSLSYNDTEQQKKINNYFKNLSLYDQFETVGKFDILWLSDEIKSVMSDMHVQMLGKDQEVRNNFFRREIKENSEYITFYVLANHDISLVDQPCAWHMYIDIDGKHYFPTNVKMLEITGYLKKLLGKRYTIHKDVYQVQFARQTNEGEDIFIGAQSMKLYFNGISHYGYVEWSMSLHRSFLKTMRL